MDQPTSGEGGKSPFHSTSGAEPKLVRTRESIDPQISVSVQEIDPQSTQYSCEVTVSNIADEEFEVVEVGYRLPKGVSINKAIDSAEDELELAHKETCEKISAILTNSLILEDQEIAAYQAGVLSDQLNAAYKPSNIISLYFNLLIRRMPNWLLNERKRHLKIEIGCAADAERALEKFPLSKNLPARRFVELLAVNLKHIEKEDNFKSNRPSQARLRKGQQYKTVYIVGAKRGKFSPSSYSVSFDVALRRDDYRLSRVESATVRVPASHIFTTIIAIVSAIIGALIEHVSNGRDAGTQIQATNWATAWAYVSNVGILVPILTAIIVYTIFDMTSLREKMNFSRNWRTAVLVGFICGFLNEKVLNALGALLG